MSSSTPDQRMVSAYIHRHYVVQPGRRYGQQDTIFDAVDKWSQQDSVTNTAGTDQQSRKRLSVQLLPEWRRQQQGQLAANKAINCFNHREVHWKTPSKTGQAVPVNIRLTASSFKIRRPFPATCETLFLQPS